MSDGTPEGKRTLASKLDYLFETVRPRGRTAYTHEEVATEIAKRGGPTVSASYIWSLRTGKKDNPTMRHLEALADFFGVPPHTSSPPRTRNASSPNWHSSPHSATPRFGASP